MSGSIIFAGTEKVKATPPPVIAAYIAFLCASIVLYNIVAHEDAVSSIITVAEMLQCLGLMLLGAQILSTGSAAGVSARGLGAEMLALCCRLSSTLFYHGYLPVDESGDWFYQCVDLCALAVTVWLLHQVLVVRRDTYQEEADSFPVGRVLIVAFVLAAILHGDMNARPVFDTLWMAGLFFGVVAVLPQLWLLVRTGGHVQALMSHYIFVMALSRAFSGSFMWMAREDITCAFWIDGINHTILAILGAHLLHLLLLGDFGYVYVKALLTQGLNCQLDLEGMVDFV